MQIGSNATQSGDPGERVAPAWGEASGQGLAWLNILVKVCGVGASFLLFLVLARTMTPDGFATVALSLVWLALGSALASLSMPAVVVRFLAERMAQGRASEARGVVIFALGSTAGVATLATLAVLAIIALDRLGLSAHGSRCAQIGALLLVPSVLLLVLTGLLQGLKRIVEAELLVNVLRPVLMLAAVGLLWWGHESSLPAATVLGAYLATSVVIVLWCAAYTLRVLPTKLREATATYSRAEWCASALGFMGVMIAAAINERVDLLVMGFTSEKSEIAVYAVASRFVQPVIVAASAASAVMIPHLLERLPALEAGQVQSVQALIRGTARTMLSVAVLALLALWLIAPWLLSLFGPHYQPALQPLLILVGGQVGVALFGPAAAVAAFTGRARIATLSLGLGIAINASLNVVLVPQLGAMGAALATATGSIAMAAAAWWWLKAGSGLDASVLASSPAPAPPPQTPGDNP